MQLRNLFAHISFFNFDLKKDFLNFSKIVRNFPNLYFPRVLKQESYMFIEPSVVYESVAYSNVTVSICTNTSNVVA